MKKIAILSLALALGVSPLALAQTSTTGQTTTPPAPSTQNTEQTPTAPSTQSTEQTPAVPSTDQKATETAPSTEQKSTTDTATMTPSTSQSAAAEMSLGKEHLASEIIGATVYAPNGDNIGDVNDLVVGEDGKLSMAVIGVGGFLGMGEKHVAVEMSRLRFEKAPATMATDTTSTTTTTTTTTPPAAEADNWRIVLDTTADELKTMPDFDRSKY